MAERKRSQDGHRETEDVLGQKPEELPESPDHAGSAGGEMNRKVGKRDEDNAELFPVMGALDPNDIAVAVGERVLSVCGPNEEVDARVRHIRSLQSAFADTRVDMYRHAKTLGDDRCGLQCTHIRACENSFYRPVREIPHRVRHLFSAGIR